MFTLKLFIFFYFLGLKNNNPKKRLKHFIGQVKHKTGNTWNVLFMKHKKNNTFSWPEIEDMDDIEDKNIIRIVSKPNKDRRDNLNFNIDFAGFHI